MALYSAVHWVLNYTGVPLTTQDTLPGILGFGLLGKRNLKITWEKNYFKGLLSLQNNDL